MMKRLLLALLVSLLPAVAQGQVTVLQGGSWSAGLVPTYSNSGGGSTVVQSAGTAGGGGVGVRELALIARGTGTAPFSGQGGGFQGSNFCSYDGPITGPHHQLCLSPNATGGVGLLSYNAFGGAPPLGFEFNINGVVTSLSDITMASVAIKSPVQLATTANITLSGEQTIDGVMTNLSRVLVKNQTLGAQNGCYVSSPSAWTRCSDWLTTGQVAQGTLIYVTQGALSGGVEYVVSTSGVITIGTTSVAIVPARLLPDTVRYVQQFGAVCDGTVDDIAALNLAIASGFKLTAGGATCAISGNWTIGTGTSSPWIQDITIKQISGTGAGTQRIIFYQGTGSPTLKRVKVNRNGSPTDQQSISNSAAIFLVSSTSGDFISQPHLEDLEVWGDGEGAGIHLERFVGGYLKDWYVHDMLYQRAVDPCGEVIIGIYLAGDGTTPTNATLINPRTARLGGRIVAGVPSGACANGDVSPPNALRWYQADGMDIYATIGLTILGGANDKVFEAVDSSSSSSPVRSLSIIGMQNTDIDAIGFKIGGNSHDVVIQGTSCVGCGVTAAMASGAAENIRVVDSYAIDTGSNGYWAASVLPVAGFQQHNAGLGPVVSMQCINCVVVDRQPVPTTEYCFTNGNQSAVTYRLINPTCKVTGGAFVEAYFNFPDTNAGIYEFTDSGTFLSRGRISITNTSATSEQFAIDSNATTAPSAISLFAGGVTPQARLGFYPSTVTPGTITGSAGIYFWGVTAQPVFFGANNLLAGTIQASDRSLVWNSSIQAATFLAAAPGLPVASSCGTGPTIGARSSNNSGSFTTGTGTPSACTLTFATPFPGGAYCTVVAANAAAIGTTVRISSSSSTAFQVTLGAGTDSAAYNYTCVGN